MSKQNLRNIYRLTVKCKQFRIAPGREWILQQQLSHQEHHLINLSKQCVLFNINIQRLFVNFKYIALLHCSPFKLLWCFSSGKNYHILFYKYFPFTKWVCFHLYWDIASCRRMPQFFTNMCLNIKDVVLYTDTGLQFYKVSSKSPVTFTFIAWGLSKGRLRGLSQLIERQLVEKFINMTSRQYDKS